MNLYYFDEDDSDEEIDQLSGFDLPIEKDEDTKKYPYEIEELSKIVNKKLGIDSDRQFSVDPKYKFRNLVIDGIKTYTEIRKITDDIPIAFIKWKIVLQI